MKESSISKSIEKLFGKKSPENGDEKAVYNEQSISECKTLEAAEAYIKKSDLTEWKKKYYVALWALVSDSPADAIRRAEVLIESNRDDPYGHAILGFAQRKAGRFQEAYASVAKGKNLKHDIYHINNTMFVYEYMQVLQSVRAYGDQMVFLNEFEQADNATSEIEPAEVCFLRSTVFAEANKFDAAWAEYYRGFKMNPHHHRAGIAKSVLAWRDNTQPSLHKVH